MADLSPTPGTIVLRGVRRRCGRCGAKHIFAGYFTLRERCPRCGYRFVREEGAFTGVMLMNMVATFTLMIAALLTWVFWRGVTGESVALWPFAAACLAFAVLGPAIFYPWAASTWAAMDLAMRPLDPVEQAEAATFAATGPTPEDAG